MHPNIEAHSYLLRRPVMEQRTVESYRPKPGRRMALVAAYEKRGYEEVDGPQAHRVYLKPTRDLTTPEKLDAFCAAYDHIDSTGVAP